jgi:hypothetical protein
VTICLPISKKQQATYRNFPLRPTTTFLPERALEYRAKLNLLSITRRAGNDSVADGKDILQCLGLADAAEGEIVPQAKWEPGQWIEDEAHV